MRDNLFCTPSRCEDGDTLIQLLSADANCTLGITRAYYGARKHGTIENSFVARDIAPKVRNDARATGLT